MRLINKYDGANMKVIDTVDETTGRDDPLRLPRDPTQLIRSANIFGEEAVRDAIREVRAETLRHDTRATIYDAAGRGYKFRRGLNKGRQFERNILNSLFLDVDCKDVVGQVWSGGGRTDDGCGGRQADCFEKCLLILDRQAGREKAYLNGEWSQTTDGAKSGPELDFGEDFVSFIDDEPPRWGGSCFKPSKYR